MNIYTHTYIFILLTGPSGTPRIPWIGWPWPSRVQGHRWHAFPGVHYSTTALVVYSSKQHQGVDISLYLISYMLKVQFLWLLFFCLLVEQACSTIGLLNHCWVCAGGGHGFWRGVCPSGVASFPGLCTAGHRGAAETRGSGPPRLAPVSRHRRHI